MPENATYSFARESLLGSTAGTSLEKSVSRLVAVAELAAVEFAPAEQIEWFHWVPYSGRGYKPTGFEHSRYRGASGQVVRWPNNSFTEVEFEGLLGPSHPSPTQSVMEGSERYFFINDFVTAMLGVSGLVADSANMLAPVIFKGNRAHLTSPRSNELTAQEYVSLLRRTLLPDLIAPLIERIEKLRVFASNDDDPGQMGLRQESLVGFLKFLYRHSAKIVNRPSLVLTLAGNLRARWKMGFGSVVTVEFIDASNVTYVIFRPDANDPTTINRGSGTSKSDSFFEVTATHEL